MKEKVFLLSKKSKFRTDADVNVNVQFEANNKLLLNTDLGETLSLYDLYNEERNKTNKFRLIIDINPICSNVLFNNVSEIVKYRDDGQCVVIKRQKTGFQVLGMHSENVINKSISDSGGVSTTDAIRDTEFSHSNFGDFIYNCGSDIFNNHILRANEFIHVGMADLTKTSDEANEPRKNFNTIVDYQRDSFGNIVVDNCYYSDASGATINKHIHNLDGLSSLQEAFLDNCIDKDGWFGFVNKTLIDIPNVKIADGDNTLSYTINKAVNNKNACSFVDMYPDRTLFSFTPIYNKRKSRIEQNWDYCLTYPFESDYEKFNEINGNAVNAIKCISTEITHNNSGDELIQFKTLTKHNLSRGSFISLYYTESPSDRTKMNKIPFKVRVSAIGDAEGNNTETVFRIKMSDVSSYVESDENRVIVIGGKACLFFIKKVVRGSECKYYFRKFKKLTYDNKLPASEINKLAFAENIYGDHISQLIYTDDIDVTGLVDNLGMPLTKIYLTIVKANRGNVEWYENKEFNDENVECSHAFGKVTSGIELPETYYNYNIHKLHNLDFSHLECADERDYDDYEVGTRAVFSNFLTQPLALEGGGYYDKEGITVSRFDEFYGDIVEFNFEECDETVIGNVYHRFNTKQREVYNPEYFDIIEDVLKSDDYFNENDASSDLSEETKLNYASVSRYNTDMLYAGNLAPEGYYYKPHHEIVIRDKSEEITRIPVNLINYDANDVIIASGATEIEYTDGTVDNITTSYLTIKADSDYGFKPGDTIILYNIVTDSTIYGFIEKVENSGGIYIHAVFNDIAISDDDIKEYRYAIAHTNKHCQSYGRFSLQDREVVWRDIMKPSGLLSDSDLYETPFSNGAFYVHKNINFFLRRQDPNNEFFMSDPEDDYRGVSGSPKKMRAFRKHSYGKLTLDALKYVEELLNSDCM